MQASSDNLANNMHTLVGGYKVGPRESDHTKIVDMKVYSAWWRWLVTRHVYQIRNSLDIDLLTLKSRWPLLTAPQCISCALHYPYAIGGCKSNQNCAVVAVCEASQTAATEQFWLQTKLIDGSTCLASLEISCSPSMPLWSRCHGTLAVRRLGPVITQTCRLSDLRTPGMGSIFTSPCSIFGRPPLCETATTAYSQSFTYRLS